MGSLLRLGMLAVAFAEMWPRRGEGAEANDQASGPGPGGPFEWFLWGPKHGPPIVSNLDAVPSICVLKEMLEEQVLMVESTPTGALTRKRFGLPWRELPRTVQCS